MLIRIQVRALGVRIGNHFENFFGVSDGQRTQKSCRMMIMLTLSVDIPRDLDFEPDIFSHHNTLL